MKGKFRSMWRVGIALVLVAGLSLVAAVPAAALTQPDVTVTDPTISAETTYSIVFSLGAELPIGGKIVIEFPTGTDLTNVVDGDIGILASTGIGSATITGGTFTTVKSPDATIGPTLTATLTGLTGDTLIGVGAIVQVTVSNHVGNPDTVADYTLDVSTLDSANATLEAAVTSASYSITAPVLGGTVEVFNPSGVKMETYSGAAAVATAVTNHGDHDDYTIEVGPGTYTVSSTLTISGEGLTLVSTDGAAETIIDASGVSGFPVISITADDVTVDGFTIEDGGNKGIEVGAFDGAVIQNNIIEVETIGINLGAAATGATVSGNTMDGCGCCGVYLDTGGDNTIEDNTITGCGYGSLEGGIVFATANDGNTISGNTITDNDGNGILFWGGAPDDNLIEGNTISGNEKHGILIDAASDPTELVIRNNDITDNDGVGILVASWTPTDSAIKFNNITGNDTTNGYGLQNATTEDVDATHNWWGTSVASEVGDMVYDSSTGDTDYTPFLSDTVDAVFSATAVTTGSVTSLDAETEVGVVVLASSAAEVVSAAKYIDNPGTPLDNALAFYDVYVAGGSPSSTDTVTLRFYAGDDDAVLYAWSSSTETWIEVTPAAVFNPFRGFLYVTLNDGSGDSPSTPTIGDLTELPFAVCGEEAPPEDIVDYYRGADGIVSTSELLTAITDWAAGAIPSGFTEALTTTQLLALITEWAS